MSVSKKAIAAKVEQDLVRLALKLPYEAHTKDVLERLYEVIGQAAAYISISEHLGGPKRKEVDNERTG